MGLLGTPILNNSRTSILARKKVWAVKNKRKQFFKNAIVMDFCVFQHPKRPWQVRFRELALAGRGAELGLPFFPDRSGY